MSKPEALRLADLIRSRHGNDINDEAAAELRRLHAANEQLATEVANRNRRALDGDEAVFALANVHAYYEKLEAQRDALLEALKELMVAADRVSAEPVTWLGKARAAIAKAEGAPA